MRFFPLQLQVVPDVGFLDALASQCLSKLPDFTAEQLATSLWATLAWLPDHVLHACPGAFSPVQVAFYMVQPAYAWFNQALVVYNLI
jgi:hypothetical protein